MPQQNELMAYISVLEDSIAPQMKAVDNSVRTRWQYLPQIKTNTVYHQCPYFGLFLGDIEHFFETGLMRIAHDIARQYNAYAGESLELTLFGVNRNYAELIEGYCTPFVDAFQAASSGGINRLNRARRELESSASDRRYGYITNSFTFLLAAETIGAISSAMRAVENDNKAWQIATAPQQTMHNKLSALWNSNFESAFMKQIEAENVLVTRAIIEQLCITSKFTYQTYLDAKASTGFSDAKAQFMSDHQSKNAAVETAKQTVRKKIVSELKAQITDVDNKLANMGFVLWGDKRKERKSLEQHKEQLSAEVQATISWPRLPSTYVFTLPHESPAYKKFSTTVFDSDFFKKDWTFEYSADEKGYIAYMPDGNPLFVLSGDFLRLYGHGRSFGGRYESFLDEAANATVSQVRFALFEK